MEDLLPEYERLSGEFPYPELGMEVEEPIIKENIPVESGLEEPAPTENVHADLVVEEMVTISEELPMPIS